MSESIHIRPLSTIDEYTEAEEVQHRAWSMDDYRNAVPQHLLLTAQKNGGLVAGAFDEQNRMLGFVFGFLGLSADGKLKHCSHMMGILPEYQRHNIGYRLKCFQRQYVQKQDIDLITWTYDPLEGQNAMLNISKLGCVVHKYFHNMYGDSLGGLNRGLPTDRFEVEWWLNSPHVVSVVDQGRERSTLESFKAKGAEMKVTAVVGSNGLPRPEVNGTWPEVAVIEIPSEFQRIKTADPDLAQEWRHLTALLFTQAFSNHYTIIDFASQMDGPTRRNYYLLVQDGHLIN